MNSANLFHQLLYHGLSAHTQRIQRALLQTVATEYRAWVRQRDDVAAHAQDMPEYFSEYLLQAIADSEHEIARLHHAQMEFSSHYAHTPLPVEQRRLILEFAARLGASRRQLHGDRNAFARWFGYDAVNDRYLNRVAEQERWLAFLLGRLGVAACEVLRRSSSSRPPSAAWRRVAVEEPLLGLLTYPGDDRVRENAFRALATALSGLPRDVRAGVVAENTLRYIFRAVQDRRLPVWIQCEALSLLASLDNPAHFVSVLEKRLRYTEEDRDDIFVRRRCVELLVQNLDEHAEMVPLLDTLNADPSPYVRQTAAEMLARFAVDGRIAAAVEVFTRLLHADSVAQVRAAALLALEAEIAAHPATVTAWLEECLRAEQDAFVLRTALYLVPRCHRRLREVDAEAAQTFAAELYLLLAALHAQAAHLPARRWAAQAREQVWCEQHPAARALREQLAARLSGLREGATCAIRRRDLVSRDEALLGRVLAVLALHDHGFDVESTRRNLYITRGHVFGFRLWRFWHEWRTPSTDKRQGFTHCLGRIFQGQIQAPPSHLAELAQTVVPGEPLHIGAEGDWRPFLPLPDTLLAALEQNRPIQVYSSEGMTEVVPPRPLWRRVFARYRLITGFSRYAELRNWQSGNALPPDSYLETLQSLGFAFRFQAHAEPYPSTNPAVQHFFPALVPFDFWDERWERLWTYFFSVYENSLAQLALFLSLGGAFFFGRHVVASRRIRYYRRRIPLSVGGWGTRGKSGTERLKAALINALGHSVVSKTTGCEAMFLYARPFGPLREMFLFRPYDKATIWEQAQVLSLAARLQAEVFLWECMALTPEYVKILSQQWMRDDFATLTNAYPDHEDLQGPAGINIPRVMLNFVPHRSLLLTSEENMLPILRSGAQVLGTEVKTVHWLHAGLICPDVLARFPYDEHPYNIALVLAMGREMGLEEDFMLKEMADRVVLDLGVLKTYPTAECDGRRLQFINGMSANERYGCLGNWTRLGFSEHDCYADPTTWITTVVNNRADRIPRSRVFASILVNDISADRHFLIGTNLDGLRSYVREAWDESSPNLTLWADPDSAPEQAVERLTAYWRRLRLCYHETHMQAVAGLLAEEPEDPARRAALETHLAQQQAMLSDYMQLREQCANATATEQRAALDEQLRARLWHWFQQKLVVIEDPYASGEQVLQRIIGATPPGFYNRCLGMQNIKGTGLDFVYRWQAWDTCYQALEKLAGSQAQTAEQGLRELTGFQEYGQLSEFLVRQTLEQVKTRPLAQNEFFQAGLARIGNTLEQTMTAVHSQLHTGTAVQGGGWFSTLVNGLEAFLDARDAVKRRKRTNLIYRELMHERISHERAALELKAFNKRQKGGWLAKSLQCWFN